MDLFGNLKINYYIKKTKIMNETNNWLAITGITPLGNSGTTTLGYSGTINGGYSGNINAIGTQVSPGLTLQGNSTINYSNILGISPPPINSNNMSKQVKVAVFTIKRNDKNEVISSTFVKEFWVEQKNGSSIVLAASKQLDKDFDPDTTVIRELSTVQF
jgi:hypothetical protein